MYVLLLANIYRRIIFNWFVLNKYSMYIFMQSCILLHFADRGPCFGINKNWQGWVCSADHEVRTLLTAGLKAKCTNTNPRSTLSSPRGPLFPLCPISPLLRDNKVSVHSSLTRSFVFHPYPKCPNTRCVYRRYDAYTSH